jgi:hypothetical protein
VVFEGDWTTTAGLQLSIAFDPRRLVLLEAEPLALGITSEHFAVHLRGRSAVTACFENPTFLSRSATAPPSAKPEALFALHFRALQTAELRDALWLGDEPTPTMAFSAGGEELRPLLHWTEEPALQQPTRPTAFPNPFGAEGLQLHLSQTPEPTAVRIFSVEGHLLGEMAVQGPSLHLKSEYFPTPGAYWIAIRRGKEQWHLRVVRR